MSPHPQSLSSADPKRRLDAHGAVRTTVLLSLMASLVACGDKTVAPSPTVAIANPIRGGMTVELDEQERPIGEDARIEEGAIVATTHSAGSLRLDNGAWLLLAPETSIVVYLDKVALKTGKIWVDTQDSVSTTLVEPGGGELRATDATFAVSAVGSAGEGAEAYCASGEITFARGEEGAESGLLAQGETLTFKAGELEPEPSDVWEDWTGGLADPTPRPIARGYVGALYGRAISMTGRARSALPVRNHEVRVQLEGDAARTKVTQTFFNAQSDPVEAVYELKLPEGAVLEEVEVNRGGTIQLGSVVPVATSGYTIQWSGAETAGVHFAYDGPNRLRARIQPVAPGTTCSVRVQYTEWVERIGPVRRYRYPMAGDGAPPLLGEFDLSVEVRGQQVGGYRAGMGATRDGNKVSVRRSDWRPRSDFYLEVVDKQPPNDEIVAYIDRYGDAGAHVLFDVPIAEWLPAPDPHAPVELLFVVDSSGASTPEELELSRAIIEATIRQLAPTDKIALKLADVSLHDAPGAPVGLVTVSEGSEAILEAVSRIAPSGATDLGESLVAAARELSGHASGSVIYLGDAMPTTGALDATTMREELAAVPNTPRVFGVGVGDGANMDLLYAVLGERAVHVQERTAGARAMAKVLAEASRPIVRDVTLDLGGLNIERPYPSRVPLLTSRSLRVTARYAGELPKEMTVRAMSNGELKEKTLPVTVIGAPFPGDVAKRWAKNRLAELIDSRAGREAIVDLGQRFALLTPWTVLSLTSASNHTSIGLFDHDPFQVSWALGGRAPSLPTSGLGQGLGWRRRMSQNTSHVAAFQRAWPSRVTPSLEPDDVDGDGGLGIVSVQRALRTNTAGPRGCYERKRLTSPGLRGDVSVRVKVRGDGSYDESEIVSSSLGAPDVARCIQQEISGISFPAIGGNVVQIVHVYNFNSDSDPYGRRQCSAASRFDLRTRRGLWRERLGSYFNTDQFMRTYNEARANCELKTWQAKRALLDLMLEVADGTANRIQLFGRFDEGAEASYIKRRILRELRSPADANMARQGLGFHLPLVWRVFSRDWKKASSPERRLTLVRKWLEVAPDEVDLRLRLLALLEETGDLDGAKRLARELRSAPLTDAHTLTRVGEFWSRQGDEAEARRVFSEIVEHAPLDPFARERLGSLYLAHDQSGDAYREFKTLSALRPSSNEPWLWMSRAAASAGRTDESLRIEQRIGESAAEGDPAADAARAWTRVRLGRLKIDASAEMRAQIHRRERQTGALRNPPAVFLALTWTHPDDAPGLFVERPTPPSEDYPWELAGVRGQSFGLAAVEQAQREAGTYRFAVVRSDRESLRALEAEVLIITGLGSEAERVQRLPVSLTKDERVAVFTLSEDGLQRATLSENARDKIEEDVKKRAPRPAGLRGPAGPTGPSFLSADRVPDPSSSAPPAFDYRSARVARVRTGNPNIRGNLSKEVIRRVIRRHRNHVKFCYEQQLNHRPDLEGRVTVSFVIDAMGRVQTSSLGSSTLGNEASEQCIVSAARRWTFPAPEGGGIVAVEYPFMLSSAGGG